MRRLPALLLMLVCALPLAARADDADPWVSDLVVGKAAWSDAVAKGILAIKDHRDDLERALAGAQASIARAGARTDPATVLVDGQGETIMAMALPVGGKDQPKSIVTADNPYPRIAFLLGSYYDETGSPQDAIRVLTAGLAADPLAGLGAGEFAPFLDCERGVALLGLKRWPESLASYDEGLKHGDLDNGVHAKLLRGRGYALTELDRLDEAEAAYRESLKFDPGSALAQHELDYIANLRKGGAREAPGGIKPLTPPASGGN